MNRKLIKSLLKPDAYPEPTTSVSLIETHVSLLFVTDRFVYKVKKPVDFGFLNFTTPDRRRFYCGEEVRLNRRLCPDLYLGVQELRETPSGGAFTGSGPAIDYAVKMRRLPEERMLNRLLENGQAGEAELRQVAETVAHFHLAAPQGDKGQRYGTREVVRENWEENFRHAARMPWLAAADFALIKGWVETFLNEKRELFEERVKGGFVRECDGDLHLANICLADKIYIFDCIEFSDTLRITDTAADVAFLLMDLEYHDKGELIPFFLESYLALTKDAGMAPLLPFYQSYRAFVRGKVAGLLISEGELDEEKLLAAKAEARRYFRLSRGYLLRDKLPPTLMVACGVTGTGKSTLARELALQLGLTRLSSDRTRKALAGLSPTTRAGAPPGKGIYSASFDKKVYGELLRRAEEALAAGRSVIVDATFQRSADRARFRDMAAARGVPFLLVHLSCPEETVLKRLEARKEDPREVSDGSAPIYAHQKAHFHEIAPAERALAVDGAAPPEESAEAVLRALRLIP